MLGHKLLQVLGDGIETWFTLRGGFSDVAEFNLFDERFCIEGIDVENPVSIRNAIVRAQPSVVINAVGIIKQIPTSNDTIRTLTVNSIFPHRLSELAAEIGFRLVCVSTDCVFDGRRGDYSEADVPNAVDLYGKSKNLGEVVSGNCLTLRTSIIGRELATADSLVEWFLSNRNGSVKGFARAIYSGFPTIVLAEIIKNLILDNPELRGLYHLSSDPISKYDLLRHLNRAYGSHISVERDEAFKIDRSLDSTKFRNETGFVPPSWEEMIQQMASDPTPYDLWHK